MPVEDLFSCVRIDDVATRHQTLQRQSFNVEEHGFATVRPGLRALAESTGLRMESPRVKLDLNTFMMLPVLRDSDVEADPMIAV